MSEPRWVRTLQLCRCTECKQMATVVWLYYPNGTTWTLALCEPCVERKLEGSL